MELYLIRHAHALDAEDDAARPLSERGRSQVRALAEFLRPGGALHPTEFWHSPLVRARETAELLARELGLRTPVRQVSGLEPCDDQEICVEMLAGLSDPLAVVGHEPHLSSLASLLVASSAAPLFVVRKCAVIALEGAGRRWQVRWHLSPELLA